MIKYFKQKKYKEANKRDDLQDKEFYLDSISYVKDEDRTVLGNTKLERSETYILALKSFDPSTFNTTIESIVNNALNDGVNAYGGISITAEREENRYLLTITFNIKG